MSCQFQVTCGGGCHMEIQSFWQVVEVAAVEGAGGG